ncbi:hypothetical protein [Saccharicrinis aurantiacus]|uniref:hypothetical protein n=1 Tax=Saccharicrinis aurantiacus TaxID=1849719 RepID=UPI00249275DA|nr:hypothetical protein [Saccharicrinis aurantiacus]
MKRASLTKTIALSLFMLACASTYSQNEIDRWDNWLILGNKIVFGGDKDYRHSHELQWRVDNNMQNLDQWFYEGVFTYTPNKNWEVVPDFRASVQSDRLDFRLGLGAVNKQYLGSGENGFNSQFVTQTKYQLDFDNKNNVRHGIRIVFSYNYIYSKKLLIGGLVGPFYRWSENFTGIEFIRGGPTFTYIFDEIHTIAFAPLFGAGNIKPNGWAYSFTPMISIIFRVNKDYKYIPAKYINF